MSIHGPRDRKKADGTYVVSTKFHSLDRMFETETGILTRGGRYGPYVYLSDQAAIDKALKWQKARRRVIFLRDALDCSVALDFNLAEAAVYTEMGKAEHKAKANRDHEAVRYLIKKCLSAVIKLGLYKECDSICAVPPSPEKKWDLPTEIANQVAARSSKDNISSLVRFKKSKQSVKAIGLSEKWGALQSAQLEVNGNVKDKRIILIDDKYQSGTTIQFVASKLLEAGAIEVLGLSCVKTWRDTDNT
jgi:phosphoribosylpyrophosphate synthetase